MISCAFLLILSACAAPMQVSYNASEQDMGLKRTYIEAIWIDADPISRPNQTADIDDVLAIRILINAGVTIRGLSTVQGNGTEEAVWKSAIAEFPDLPVFRGSGTSGCRSPAVIALLAASRQQSLTILALGPLTNVATAMDCDPSLRSRISRIIAVAGRLAGERFTLTDDDEGPVLRDLNYEMDRQAFRIILDSGVPLDLVPFAAGNQIRLGFGDLSRLPPHLLERAWSWSLILRLIGAGGTLPAFDPAAAALLLWPDQFAFRKMTSHAGRDLVVSPSDDGAITTIRYCLPSDANRLRYAISRMLH